MRYNQKMRKSIHLFKNKEYLDKRSKPYIKEGKGDPWVYIWIRKVKENGKFRPIYIGETGANTYKLVDRLKGNIGLCKRKTLHTIKKSYPRYGGNLKEEFEVHAFLLSEIAKGREHSSGGKYRKSVESWLHQIVCHEKKVQSKFYCGIKYEPPNPKVARNARNVAENIYNLLAKTFKW
ncbi:MAG: hypothetical protein L6408_02560 [Nanoarchaeota archaeon]|nr:hypothetical protein [Nanoarchaeota archaeon]